VRLSISAEVSEIDSLFDWLTIDRELARSAVVSAAPPEDSSALSALEVINVVLTHVEAAVTLLLTLDAWRQTRSTPGPVTLTRADGKSLTIGGDPEVTSELIVAFLSGTPEPAGSPQPER
jgi:hypothetical protein